MRRILICALLLYAPMLARCQSKPSHGWYAAYRAAQASLVASAGFDYRETYWGLRHTTGRESGEASWFVDSHSASKVIAFNIGEDAVCLYAAHWMDSRRSRWWKAAAIGLIGAWSFAHVRGGESWGTLPRK